jgi:hypothetical protein
MNSTSWNLPVENLCDITTHKNKNAITKIVITHLMYGTIVKLPSGVLNICFDTKIGKEIALATTKEIMRAIYK